MKTFCFFLKRIPHSAVGKFLDIQLRSQMEKIVTKSFLSLLGGLMALTGSAFGQIAVPSLDRTQPADMPGAAGWRFSSTIGAAVNPSGAGAYKDSDGEKTDELKRTWLEGFVFHQFEDVVFEYNKLFEFREERENLASGDTTTQKIQQDRINLALRLKEIASIGITQRTWENQGDVADSLGKRWETGYGKEVGIGAGISLRLAELFHLAFGLEDVTHRLSGREDNRWTDRYLAVALMGEGNFRLEYAKIQSPESVKTGAVDHPASDDSRLGIDIAFSDWVLSYERQDYVIEPIGSGDDTRFEFQTLGLALCPQDGLLLSFRVISGKHDDSYETTDARFTIGYNY